MKISTARLSLPWMAMFMVCGLGCGRVGVSVASGVAEGGDRDREDAGDGDANCSDAALSYCETAICPLGCLAAESRCKEVQPSNLEDTGLINAGSAPLLTETPGEVLTLDTDTGQIDSSARGTVRLAGEGDLDGVHFAIVPQQDAPAIGVFSCTALEVTSGTTLELKGVNAAALLASQSVTIAGAVRAQASTPLAGPGGFSGGNTMAPGLGPGGGGVSSNHLGEDHGGGGGGYGDTGGAGGLETSSTDTPAPGGVAYGTATLAPLRGGSGGAGGGHTGGGVGGGGGGAVQISSRAQIHITSTGIINVSGAGGTNGGCGGAGGGSGGAILLEAVDIELQGRLLANGGGGGAGSSEGSWGEDGRDDAVRASGGQNPRLKFGGAGGAGSVTQGDPGDDSGTDRQEACGGGGGTGRIRLNTKTATVAVGNAVLSPSPGTIAFSIGQVIDI